MSHLSRSPDLWVDYINSTLSGVLRLYHFPLRRSPKTGRSRNKPHPATNTSAATGSQKPPATMSTPATGAEGQRTTRTPGNARRHRNPRHPRNRRPPEPRGDSEQTHQNHQPEPEPKPTEPHHKRNHETQSTRETKHKSTPKPTQRAKRTTEPKPNRNPRTRHGQGTTIWPGDRTRRAGAERRNGGAECKKPWRRRSGVWGWNPQDKEAAKRPSRRSHFHTKPPFAVGGTMGRDRTGRTQDRGA